MWAETKVLVRVVCAFYNVYNQPATSCLGYRKQCCGCCNPSVSLEDLSTTFAPEYYTFYTTLTRRLECSDKKGTSYHYGEMREPVCATEVLSKITCYQRACKGRNERIPLNLEGAVVAERLDCSPPPKASRAQSPAGSFQDFRKSKSCQTMPMVGGFSWGSLVSPFLLFRRYTILTSFHTDRLSRPRYKEPLKSFSSAHATGPGVKIEAIAYELLTDARVHKGSCILACRQINRRIFWPSPLSQDMRFPGLPLTAETVNGTSSPLLSTDADRLRNAWFTCMTITPDRQRGEQEQPIRNHPRFPHEPRSKAELTPNFLFIERADFSDIYQSLLNFVFVRRRNILEVELEEGFRKVESNRERQKHRLCPPHLRERYKRTGRSRSARQGGGGKATTRECLVAEEEEKRGGGAGHALFSPAIVHLPKVSTTQWFVVKCCEVSWCLLSAVRTRRTQQEPVTRVGPEETECIAATHERAARHPSHPRCDVDCTATFRERRRSGRSGLATLDIPRGSRGGRVISSSRRWSVAPRQGGASVALAVPSLTRLPRQSHRPDIKVTVAERQRARARRPSELEQGKRILTEHTRSRGSTALRDKSAICQPDRLRRASQIHFRDRMALTVRESPTFGTRVP
ncbi:hypothetical protein PR048_016963 [Dryococelus australis]|uniref:Uncharacterized protein n=1 Tax=Dryococelus australis TaxID=614101 RepID=A0ABQ9H8R2_9NEOP|nr:hypothetical protein PR048_016963 [Dryococelus australis]